MNPANATFSPKAILSTIAMALVATFGIIASGSIDEALLDTIQAW